MYHLAANAYEQYHESETPDNKQTMLSAARAYILEANGLKRSYYVLPWNLFGLKYLYSLLQIHLYYAILMVITINGLVDAHFESYPGNVHKTEDVRHLDFCVRLVESILVVVISFFPFLRIWVEVLWGLATMGATVIRAWRILVGAGTGIDSPRDYYNLISGAITGGCRLLILVMAIPAVDMSVPAPFASLRGIGSNLTKEERTNLLPALLRSKIFSPTTVLTCSARLT